MGVNPIKTKQKILAASISACVLASVGVQAQDDGMEEELIVRGIRASIETSINTKRNAATVVDAITAEDIGKLPDVTISDSLQRISGIQIRRSAGEGSSVNIRGLAQVVTQLNGEQYLGANSVVSVQPNFGDIPSQLFKGAEVYKSSTASMGSTGITGTVNLQTYRPFDFDEGLTTAVSAEIQQGVETSETDPVLAGLINWQNEKVGFMLAASLANVNLSNSYNGINTGSPGDAGWTGRSNDADVIATIGEGGSDSLAIIEGLNSGDDMGRQFVGSQGFSAWNQVTERERIGLNGSLQVDLGEGFELTTDWFYTNQEEYNRKVGMSATNKWANWNWFYPSEAAPMGIDTDSEIASNNGLGSDFVYWTQAELSPKRVKSFTQNDVYNNTSRNLNVQLDYDNGGAFTGQFRAVMGDAEQRHRHGYNEGDLTNGASTLGRTTNFVPASECSGETIVGDEGGCYQEINPLGYSENPHLTYDTSGEHPTWSGFDRQLAGGLGAGATLADYMANVDSYNIGAFSSENNENAKGSLSALSLKGNYKFEDSFITSVDVGIRSATRSADYERYNLFSPANGTECEAQWKATDVVLQSDLCTAGENVGEEFVPYIALGHTDLDEYNNVIWVNDFGPVNGIPGVWAVDPSDYDDPAAFHNRIFGSTSKNTIPGSTFRVELEELSYHLQANFAAGAFSGNVGVKAIDTTLDVQQNQASATSIPFGNTNFDVGDIVSTREYTDHLFSLNMQYELTEDLILRGAYTEQMVPHNLNQYGDGLTLNTVLDSTAGSPTEGQFIVSGGSLNGNPNLDPWRSTNYDLSLEWYLGDASMLSAALFRVEIESFTESTTVMMPQPDADGIVRREVNISLNQQGEGGELEGLELNAKVAFGDFLDGGFLSNVGIDANYTHAPSEGSGKDIFGDTNPFPDNSENQFNLVGWFENDRFSARIAYNYRSERLAAVNGAAWGALNVYQAPTTYVDASMSYDITDEISVYLLGSNITGEYEEYYLGHEDQFAFQNYYESRYTLGVRARF